MNALILRGLFKSKMWQVRAISTSLTVARKFNVPLSPDDMPRAGGIATMMRLPYQKTAKGLDACFVGVPFDAGASNRVGTRFGPRQIRNESSMARPYNPATGAAPFESLMVADIGDISVNTYNIKHSMQLIQNQISEILQEGCTPLVLGGCHTITYGILKAVKAKYGPVGLIIIDAHADTASSASFGETMFHGSSFYYAAEEGLLDCTRVALIGLRGPWYADSPTDKYGKEKW